MTKRTNHRFSIAGGALFGVLLLAGWSPAPLSAQDMDARWLPWLGCWEAVESGEETPLLCVRPSAEGNGVEFISWSEGELSAPETILADGVPRNVEREDCQGVEEARFSDDGHRIYLSSRYVCEEGGERKASGILAMMNPMEWADIKSVDGTPWVLKYRLARTSRVEGAPIGDVVTSRAAEVKAARIRASARLTEEDIIEATAHADGPAVEALIVERADPYRMNADLLVRLDDAGVPANIIDLMVAVSYPDRFAVKAGPMPVEELEDEEGMQARRRMYMGGSMWGSRYGLYGYNPFFFDPFYSGYGYGYGGYYGGYGGWGGYGYGYPYQPRPIVVTPISGSQGRNIKGRGYTRGGAGSGYTGGTARSRGGSSSGGGRATASPSGRSSGGSSSAGRSAKPRGGGSSGASVSSSSSRSSSSGAARRTAKPRGGGLR